MEKKEPGTPPPREGRLQPTLVLATLSAAFGSAFEYGYNIAVVNTPHKVGTRWAGEGCHLTLGNPPPSFQKPPSLPGSRGLPLILPGYLGMARLVGVLHSRGVSLSRHIGKGVRGDSLESQPSPFGPWSYCPPSGKATCR